MMLFKVLLDWVGGFVGWFNVVMWDIFFGEIIKEGRIVGWLIWGGWVIIVIFGMNNVIFL